MIMFGWVLTGLALLIAWTLLYTWVIVKHQRPKLRIAAVLVAVLLAAAPLASVLYSDAQRSHALNAATAAFGERYDNAQLLQVTKGPPAWVYSYLNDRQRHVVLRIGEDWLEVNLTPQGALE